MSDDDMISKTAAPQAVKRETGFDNDHPVVAAIAALPAVTVGVRPLVWDDDGNFCSVAKTSLGEYVVQNEQADGWGLWTPQQQDGDDPASYHPDALTAKAAAEAHHEAGILAALDLTPAPDAAAIREAALREAAALMSGAAENCRKQFTYPPKTKEQRDYQTGAIIHSNAAAAILALIQKGGA